MYRYDVRVAVHREATMPSGQGRSGPVYEGTIKTVSDWKASWVAPVYLDRCAGMKLKVTAQPAGQFDRKFDWNDTTKQTGYTDKVNANDTTKLYDVPPCHYTYASHVPARLSVTAEFGDLSANPEHKSFDFLAGQDFSDQTASKADFAHAAEARRAACDLKREGIAFRYTSIGGTTMPLNGFNGMLIGDNQLHRDLRDAAELASRCPDSRRPRGREGFQLRYRGATVSGRSVEQLRAGSVQLHGSLD